MRPAVIMRICDQHWAELRQAVDARGLSPFVADGPDEAEERVRNTMTSTTGADASNFEPMIGALLSIANNALHQFGMSAAIVGERCPLCSLATWWIERASREQLDTARRLGLVSPTTQREFEMPASVKSVPPSRVSPPSSKKGTP